ncbi:hypothetical protein [Pseudomonas sp.]
MKTMYRRMYHEVNGQVSGVLTYCPLPGLALPPFDIKEAAWI